MLYGVQGLWILVALFLLASIVSFALPRFRPKGTALFASAPAGALFALLLLFAGAVSQFYSTEIKDASPLAGLSGADIWAPHAFWVSVVLTVIFGTAHYSAGGRLRTNDVRTIKEHTGELVEQLRTQPPARFMREYGRLCDLMMKAYTDAITSQSPEKCRVAVGSALYAAAELARIADRGEADEVYSANVMHYRAASELSPVHEWTPEERSLYPEGFLPARIRGALLLDPLLSTSTLLKGSPVAALREIRIVLPDPPSDRVQLAERAGRYRMLPGAAAALHLGGFFHVPDTRNMRETMKDAFRIEEAVIARSEEYFREGEGRGVLSLVSMPLFKSAGSSRGPRIAVLNIESARGNIFDGRKDRMEQFGLALAPVRFVLWMMLGSLDLLSEHPYEAEAL
jgi:hypothetical protein